MNLSKKRVFVFIISLLFIISHSQTHKNDSLRGSFTYLLKSKPNNLFPNHIYEELFLLQISDKNAYFISEKKLKADSIYKNEFQKAFDNKSNHIDIRGKSIPKTSSQFLIIQKNDTVQFYDSIGGTLLSYVNTKINNWNLKNETKIINSFVCKRAEVRFKGRDWVAWYSPEIPFPYGPYKFGSLPGLIIKITDKKEDYDFELVKSASHSSLKGKIAKIDSAYYQNPKIVSKNELTKAKETERENNIAFLENLGTAISQDSKNKERERKKQNDTEKKGYNPIELE